MALGKKSGKIFGMIKVNICVRRNSAFSYLFNGTMKSWKNLQ